MDTVVIGVYVLCLEYFIDRHGPKIIDSGQNKQINRAMDKRQLLSGSQVPEEKSSSNSNYFHSYDNWLKLYEFLLFAFLFRISNRIKSKTFPPENYIAGILIELSDQIRSDQIPLKLIRWKWQTYASSDLEREREQLSTVELMDGFQASNLNSMRMNKAQAQAKDVVRG